MPNRSEKHPEMIFRSEQPLNAEPPMDLLPVEGSYALFDEFVWDGRKVLDRREIEVGVGGGTASLSPELEPKTVDGMTSRSRRRRGSRPARRPPSPTP